MYVYWSPNPDAQYFHVLAVSNTAARLHCNSSDNWCTLSDLPCGHSYNITVLSVRDGCESRPSVVVETSSGKLYVVKIYQKFQIVQPLAIYHPMSFIYS